MRRGAISYSKVRAITRVATRETEERLLDFARCATAAHVERLVRAWRRVDRIAEAEDDRRRHAGRHLETWVDEDGMLVVRGRLTPEVGAIVQRALDAATDRLYQQSEDERRVSAAGLERGEGVSVSKGQRRADAIGLLAESALAADLDRATAGDRYQVVVHVDADVLKEDSETGQSTLDDGIRISADTSRRIACDAAFRSENGVGSAIGSLSRLNHAACTLPVYASQPGSPPCHATLGSGWRLPFAGPGLSPAGFL